MSVMSGGTAPNGCSAGGSCSVSAGSAGISMTFSAFTSPFTPSPRQTEADRDGGGRGGGGDHDADEAVGPGRVVGGAQLEHHLLLGTEVDRLLVAAASHVP